MDSGESASVDGKHVGGSGVSPLGYANDVVPTPLSEPNSCKQLAGAKYRTAFGIIFPGSPEE